MNSFKDAFDIGIKHAEETASNVEEIDEVLKEFTTSISHLTDGKLKVSIEQQFDPQNNSPFGLAATAALLNNSGRYYDALVVENCKIKNSPKKELCEWKLSEKGYPVKLSYKGESPSCADKKSLIESLSYLISTPRSGKIFKQLMELDE